MNSEYDEYQVTYTGLDDAGRPVAAETEPTRDRRAARRALDRIRRWQDAQDERVPLDAAWAVRSVYISVSAWQPLR